MTPCARTDALLELSTEQLDNLDGDNAEHVSTCASCRSAVERKGDEHGTDDLAVAGQWKQQTRRVEVRRVPALTTPGD